MQYVLGLFRYINSHMKLGFVLHDYIDTVISR